MGAGVFLQTCAKYGFHGNYDKKDDYDDHRQYAQTNVAFS